MFRIQLEDIELKLLEDALTMYLYLTVHNHGDTHIRELITKLQCRRLGIKIAKSRTTNTT